ncbi:phospholipid-transporting ATPase ABCA3-like isoform X5 [Talpa occidentalis]|uniref:phospholipid-transporting ATPase ABCA3-like isoform X5 n=1 Tax=Talpa occidentalis TaxID=50954 RepID=UPI00188E3457|nr:phospholipid-transporting ATPase ABCA3-like isoform X5 [Talpa occidentalis]
MYLLTLKQFAVLLWKNFTIKRRRFINLILEVLTALTFPMMILLFRVNTKIHGTRSYNFIPQSISNLPFSLQNPDEWELIYVPSNINVVKEITENVQKNLNISIKAHGFSSETELERYIEYDNKALKVLAVVVFNSVFKNINDPLPLQVNYHLRFLRIQRTLSWPDNIGWKTSLLFPIHSSLGPRNPNFHDGGSPGYIREGFLAIQHALDKAIMLYHQKSAKDLFNGISISLQRFPHPTYSQDVLIWAMNSFLPLMFILMFSPTVLSIIRSIVSEREKRLKEYQLIIGLRNWMIWAAHFLTFFFFYIIIIFLICVLFFAKIFSEPIFRYSDSSFIFVFLMCYATASIFFGFMVSTFFNKARLAVSTGSILYFASFYPFNSLTQRYGEITLTKKVAACLSSNVALSLGINLWLKLEIKEIGVKWENLWTPASLEDNLVFGYLMGMLLLDALLYGLVTWFIETVFPGQFGMPQPWYFFLKYSYWFGKPTVKVEKEEVTHHRSTKNKYFETEPTNLVIGIQMEHLHKEFGDKVAVNNMSLNLYKGQISILLGQNGAGKTTIISILTGHYPPTRGEAYINGYDVSKNMIEIQRNLGFCPQSDLLFNDLTLSEHLFFYSVIKGTHQRLHSTEIDHMLSAFDLLEKRDTFARSLSAGMKRKLSIIIALIGNPKVIILDEPSSSMDPVSRRVTWNLLQQHKTDRTILLTTHYMDEADILGDRIAIMVQGSLQCCGSAVFLKKIYGVGYHIVMERGPTCDAAEIAAVIHHHVPNATSEHNIGTELSFILPKEYKHRFEALFTDLENKQRELGIASFGASITTMEDVFLKVNMLAESQKDVESLQTPPLEHQRIRRSMRHSMSMYRNYERPIFSKLNEITSIKFNTGFPLYRQQFCSMLIKRALFTRRHWKLMLLQLSVILAVTTYLLKTANMNYELPSREMDLRQYGRTVVPYSVSGHSDLAVNFTRNLKIFLNLQDQELREVQVINNSVYGFEENGIAKFLITLAAMGFFYLLLLLFLETAFWSLKNFFFQKIISKAYNMYLKSKMAVLSSSITVYEDDDVERERNKVLALSPSLSTPLLLKEVTKIYYKCPVVKAVRNISLQVKKSECFGLLGLNGAGKTTIFKMLTGEETITSGAVFIHGTNISENVKKDSLGIGYCPQPDPTLSHMTGRELLTMYARLRGVPEPNISKYVEVFLHSMHLEPHADQLSSSYSWGTKRRMNAVIALMGKSSVVFMDEPSTGMDPVARHLLWDTVTWMCRNGKAIVISSHSMEEGEALCTRVAIMVKGKFQCLGSPQHLRNKLGNIYSLTAKMKTDNTDKLKDFKSFIAKTFPGNMLNQDHGGSVGFYIPSKEICWGKVFSILEKAKVLFNLEDYSVSQITLEQIFLTFANIDKYR